MDLVTALAIVIGIMGAIATWVAVTLGSPYVLIWAIFVGWGCFFHCGGKEEGLKNSAIANLWGAVCAAVALIVALAMGITAVTAAICVGVTVAIMILGAKVPALAAIPAAVYGYASTAALFLLGAAAYGEGSGAVVKVAVAVAISMIIGNVLGYISEKIAGVLVKN
jgi:Protein of unknown function (DUF1097)